MQAIALATGKLPHEILLDIARGEQFTIKEYNKGADAYLPKTYYPTFSERMDAAKAAAPYYAPRLSAQSVKQVEPVEQFAQVLEEMSKRLPG